MSITYSRISSFPLPLFDWNVDAIAIKLFNAESSVSLFILELEAPLWVCQHVRWVRADFISQLWVLGRGPLAEADGLSAGDRRTTPNPSRRCGMPWNWA